MRTRQFILLFGVVNASLYSALLPLWGGFDEAFHYAYVEALWQTGRLPVLGRTPIPDDVFRSFQFAPVSHIHKGIAEATSYEAWFSLPQAEKEQRRRQLDLLRADSRSGPQANYEAHQPPLAYLFLAPLDGTMSHASITIRVLTLRLVAAVFSIFLLYVGTSRLCRVLGLPERFANAALFTVFCSQMLYATIAHVANDWLAVAISAMFLGALAEFAGRPDLRSGLSAGLWLAAGLLTKAYFLVFGVLFFAGTAILVWRRHAPLKTLLAAAMLVLVLAGPWYARNVVLYKNVAGTVEEHEGIGLRQALAAAPRMNWVATTGYLARSSLWTGNNSFTSFSRNTLNVVLALLLAGVAVWAFRSSGILPAERVVFAAIVLFAIAVAYASCTNFVHSHGDSAGASPWYTQVLLCPVLVLAYLGMSRSKGFGKVLGVCTVAIWTWILIATWVVKLFPMYSGAGAGPMRVHEIWNWYTQRAAAHARDLSLLTLAPGPALYAGLFVSLILSVLLSAVIVRNLSRSAV